MSNKIQLTNVKKYDLAERTARFGEYIIELAQALTNTPENQPLKSQLVRSGTSTGANYMEADAAESFRDFNHKIAFCKKN